MLAISAALLVGASIGAGESVPHSGAHVHLTLGESDGDGKKHCADDGLDSDYSL